MDRVSFFFENGRSLSETPGGKDLTAGDLFHGGRCVCRSSVSLYVSSPWSIVVGADGDDAGQERYGVWDGQPCSREWDSGGLEGEYRTGVYVEIVG